MDPVKQARLVKAIWDAMEAEGICDGFGGSEYQRCAPTVSEFVQSIHKQCNPLAGEST
jgi:hypothetical protein